MAGEVKIPSSGSNQDLEHLRLLSIFHYIFGGIMSLCGFFPIIHLAVGIGMVSGEWDNGNGPPPFFGWLFIGVAVFMMVVTWGVGIAGLVVGRKLATKSSFMFCFVVACIECMYTPFGTVLGVFTIIVLMRPSVKELFGEKG